ncbi:hypothetical protein LTR08_005059 [Meristemomyces frigidus]|nr:hypothetical protein LTR08_005059 [Meristemomyces frigidus]
MAAPPPRKRKRKATDHVHGKLEHYERLLKQHGLMELAEPSSADDGAPGVVPAGTSSAEQTLLEQHPGKLKLLAGRRKTRYIDSALWRNLAKDELDPSSDEEDVDETPYATARDPSATDPVSLAIFGPGSQSLLDLHPTYEVALKLWDVYVSHVEPITKTFHVPTAFAMVQRAASDPGATSKAVECMLFAIYHFAVTAMSEHECAKIIEQPQSEARRHYYEAAKQALVNAHFLRTADFMVLHAYTLFLLAVRDIYDPHTFWIMTGTSVRIAQRMGLHRDGEALGLKPFEVQMRRRLFWQLLPLDGCVTSTG